MLRLSKPKSEKKVHWDEEIVDNEHLGRKKSKCETNIIMAGMRINRGAHTCPSLSLSLSQVVVFTRSLVDQRTAQTVSLMMKVEMVAVTSIAWLGLKSPDYDIT